jgi:hypothetical protein
MEERETPGGDVMAVGTRDANEAAALALGIYLQGLGTMDLCDNESEVF